LSISFILAEAFHAKNYITMWVLLSSRPSPRHLPGWDWESG